VTEPRPPTRRRAKHLLASAAAAAVLLIAAWFAAKAWLLAYLHGPEFRRFLEARLGDTLHAEVSCAPLRFDGLDLFCDTVKARGAEGSPFAEADAAQVRARFSLRRVLAGAWEIEHIDAERLAVKLDGTRLATPAMRPAPHGGRAATLGFLPKRLEVRLAQVRDLQIAWGDLPAHSGALSGVSIAVKPAGDAWEIAGEGGALVVAGLPPLDVATLRLRHRGSVLFVHEAKFAGRNGGSLTALGEVDFSSALDLRARIDAIDLQPFLAGDWRARLHGRMTGDLRVQSPLPSAAPPLVSGALRLTDARLEALPVLDQIAAFTRTQQFRQLTLTRASGQFRRDANRLEVEQLAAESEGRLRVEGGFAVADGQIDGLFQVGVPPALLAWLPGSQERVFTVARDGYLWAPMRLSGPVDAPREDLSGRLAAAAGEAVLQKVEDATRDAIETGKGAAKGLLDLLVPLFR